MYFVFAVTLGSRTGRYLAVCSGCLFNLSDSINNGRATTLIVKTLTVTSFDNKFLSWRLGFCTASHRR
jgi:hypothetical protein